MSTADDVETLTGAPPDHDIDVITFRCIGAGVLIGVHDDGVSALSHGDRNKLFLESHGPNSPPRYRSRASALLWPPST